MVRRTAQPPAPETPEENANDAPPANPELGTPQNPDPESQAPGASAATTEETTAPRRRGRPAGSGKKTDKADAPGKSSAKKARDSAALGAQIVGIHMLIAQMMKMPELMINMAEGEMLANGANAIADEYGISFGGKTGAAIQLFAAAGIVYVPRLLQIKARFAKEQADREAADAAAAGSGAVYAPNGAFVGPVDTGADNVPKH